MNNLAKVSNFFSQSRVGTSVKGNTVVLVAPIRRVRRILKVAGVSFSGHWQNKHLTSITVPVSKNVITLTAIRGQTVVAFQ